MHATIRRYEGVDQARADELSKKVNESLIPKLSKLPGFAGYYLVQTETGVMSSIGLFDNVDQADECTRIASLWMRDEQLDSAFPSAPKITTGRVIAGDKTVVAV